MANKQLNAEMNLFEAIQQFSADKGLPKDAILEIIKESLISVYKKKHSISALNDTPVLEPDISVEFNEKNDVVIIVPKRVIEDGSPEPPLSIHFSEAVKLYPEATVGDTIRFKTY